MPATKRHLHRFVTERGEPRIGEGSDDSLTRQKMAAAARVQAPAIKLERGQAPSTLETISMPPHSMQKGQEEFSLPKDRASSILGWPGTTQSEACGSPMWDTDTENIDNTTTISLKNDCSKTDSNAGMQLTCNDTSQDQRCYHGSHLLESHEEHARNCDRTLKVSYQGQNIAPLHHQDHFNEDDMSSDGSADEEPADDDLTLDITDRNAMSWLKPDEVDEYKDFKESFRIRANTKVENLAKTALMLNSEQWRQDSKSNAYCKSHGKGIIARQNWAFEVGSTVDHEHSDLSQNLGKVLELSAEGPHISVQGTKLPVDSDNPVHVHGLPRSTVTAFNNGIILPQHPKKMQKFGLESIEFGSEGMSPNAARIDNDEFVKTHENSRSPGNGKRAMELDYTAEELSRMTYGKLKSEVFDHNPGSGYSGLPDSLATSALNTQLEHISTLPWTADEDRFLHQQAFFSSLPVEKYEECGDLILGHFSQILTKFKEARQSKRTATREFEEEVAQREQRVSTKLRLLEKNMERLRRAGQDVVTGKTV